MESLSAKTAKPGDVIEINGVGLSDRKIDELYLTDHKFDMRVKLIEQKDTVIKFRVPPFAKPGRMQILALTKGDDPKLLEQPLYILIEDPATQVTQVKAPRKLPPSRNRTKPRKPPSRRRTSKGRSTASWREPGASGSRSQPRPHESV